MSVRFLNIFFLISISTIGFGQHRCWIEFTHKGTDFSPYEYFDKKAIDRRVKQGLDVCDSTDFPVNSEFLDSISKYSQIVYASRWLNAVYVIASEHVALELKKFDFVKNVIKSESQIFLASYSPETLSDEDSDKLESLAYRQLALMNGRLFRENGITGKGIRIAVFDGGFPEVNKHPAFEHLRSDGRIIATFDFTKDKEFSYRGSSHGLSTLSNIGGKYGSLLIGLAPEAEYLLAVTEVNREIFKEEVWWVAAAEWADRNGAQIINSSLGYTEPRYAPRQMDGRYTMISRAANIAVSKGILVINAAGNEGMTPSWQIIGAPADADSVLSVGGVNPNSGLKINFSSFGPNASRKLKPNVAASGTTVAARPLGRFGKVDGTSFASPLVAGFAACVMQLRPGLKAMEYFDLIQKSAHLYPYFDYAHGFGIPQADYFFQARTEISKTFTAVYNRLHSDNTVQNMDLLLQDQPIPPGQESILISLMTEHTNDSEFPAFDYFYYHFANENNKLLHYEVVIPVSNFNILIPQANAKVFRAFYKGYFYELFLQ